ncbi:MAG: hypothetical protein ACE5G1_02150 [bacterium]
MKSISFPRDALEQAETVITGWERVGQKLMVPNLTVAKFVSKLEEARQRVVRAEELKVERAKAIQERNIVMGELWDLTKRVRNAAKATFGDYSSELEVLFSGERGE